MNFHLDYEPKNYSKKISYHQNIFLTGSCFAENIGALLKQYKFNVLVNPNGILYNPISIAESLQRIIAKKNVTQEELFNSNETWNHFDYHSRFSNPDRQNCLMNINNSINNAHTYLKQSEWLFITFGSAFVYQQTKNSKVVGNCHKLPQKDFIKSLLEIVNIKDTFDKCLRDLQEFNPKINVVFTVSPVRYIRDGIVENNRSKARLIEAVHHFTEKHENTFYFPAYELVIDDLRDHRFYKEDLVHPNELAIEYVFEKLKDVTLSDTSKELFEEIKKIIAAKQHKSFNPSGEKHKLFMEKYQNKCKELSKKHPFLDFKEDIKLFDSH